MLDGIDYNLVKIWQGIIQRNSAAGWDLVLRDETAFLKSPTNAPNLNLCLNPTQDSHITYAHSFFKGKTFGVITDREVIIPKGCQLQVDVKLEEMQIEVEKLSGIADVVDVIRVQDDDQLRQWSSLSAAINGLGYEDVYTFMKAFFQLPDCAFFIKYQEGNPAGIGQVYIDDRKLAYVSSIGVVEHYRKQGIGTQIMNKILCHSLNNGAQKFALHASEMGQYLYGKLGFKLSKKCSFKVLVQN